MHGLNFLKLEYADLCVGERRCYNDKGKINERVSKGAEGINSMGRRSVLQPCRVQGRIAVKASLQLEATERIVVSVVVQTGCSHGSLARAIAPLATATVTSPSRFDVQILTLSLVA